MLNYLNQDVHPDRCKRRINVGFLESEQGYFLTVSTNFIFRPCRTFVRHQSTLTSENYQRKDKFLILV